MSDIDGMDAYNQILDRLLDANANIATQRARAERAEAETRTAQQELKRVRDTNALHVRQNEATNSVHKTLLDVRKYFVDLGINKPSDWADGGALMTRLNKAITDTDEIPF